MTPKEVLSAAHQLLLEKGWTRYASARNAAQEPVPAVDPTAVSFCIIGAITAVAPNPVARDAAHKLLRRRLGNQFVSAWNDDPSRTKEEVLELLEKGITSDF